MEITKHITVSCLEKNGRKKNFFVHICCFFVFPVTISHSDNKEKEKSTATLASCKKPHSLACRIGKEIKARRRIQKYRKISNALYVFTGKKLLLSFHPMMLHAKHFSPKDHFRNILYFLSEVSESFHFQDKQLFVFHSEVHRTSGTECHYDRFQP